MGYEPENTLTIGATKSSYFRADCIDIDKPSEGDVTLEGDELYTRVKN